MESLNCRLYFGDTEYLDDFRLRLPASTSQSTGVGGQLALRFLTLVDPSRIPLQLVAGPNLVCESQNTQNIETLSKLLEVDSAPDLERPDDEDENAAHQSVCGALFKVDRSSLLNAESTILSNITELLVYGSSKEGSSNNQPSTPPRLNPQHELEKDETQRTVHPETSLFALPLSSHLLIGLPNNSQEPPSPPQEAYFLSNESLHPDLSPNTKKRNRLGDLFDQASDRRKMVRHKGGQSVSLAASRHLSTPPFPQTRTFDGIIIKSEDNGDTESLHGQEKSSVRARKGANEGKRRAQLTTLETRPKSSKGLSASTTNRSFLTVDGAEEAFQDTSTESKNKQSISRIVMAGMRIYGLQQLRSRPSTRRKQEHPNGGETSDTHAHIHAQLQAHAGTSTDVRENDEFKEVYHQTYKATTFTFRRTIATSLLQPDSVRDVVDKFLAIFCLEPEMGNG